MERVYGRVYFHQERAARVFDVNDRVYLREPSRRNP
jgi:hypothetical protein